MSSGESAPSAKRASKRVAALVSYQDLPQIREIVRSATSWAVDGARVDVYFQGPSVLYLLAHAPLRDMFNQRLHLDSHRIAALARMDVDKLDAAGATLYASGPSLEALGIDPDRLAIDGVIICEFYLTFMDILTSADVQLGWDGNAASPMVPVGNGSRAGQAAMSPL